MTYDEIKKNKEVCEYLKKGNETLEYWVLQTIQQLIAQW